MKIHVPPEAREDLLQFLRRAECVVAAEDETTVVVEVPDALGEEQAWMEVDLYVKAWQASHPHVDVQLVDPRSGVVDDVAAAD